MQDNAPPSAVAEITDMDCLCLMVSSIDVCPPLLGLVVYFAVMNDRVKHGLNRASQQDRDRAGSADSLDVLQTEPPATTGHPQRTTAHPYSEVQPLRPDRVGRLKVVHCNHWRQRHIPAGSLARCHLARNALCTCAGLRRERSAAHQTLADLDDQHQAGSGQLTTHQLKSGDNLFKMNHFVLC